MGKKKKAKKKLLNEFWTEVHDMEINPRGSPQPDNKHMDYGYRCALLHVRRMIEQKLEKL